LFFSVNNYDSIYLLNSENKVEHHWHIKGYKIFRKYYIIHTFHITYPIHVTIPNSFSGDQVECHITFKAFDLQQLSNGKDV